MNVQNNMNGMQIEFCAEQIMQQKYFYSLEDIQLCLDRGAIGTYGTIYNRIDPATILAWFPLYDQERQVYVTAKKNAETQANNIYEIFAHPQMNEALNDVVQKIEERKMQEPVKEIIRGKPSELEMALMREYDELPQWVNDQRFRLYKNRYERYRELIENQNEY